MAISRISNNKTGSEDQRTASQYYDLPGPASQMSLFESGFTFIDLFAGIGGIRLGFERAFGEMVKCVFASDWDEKAQVTCKANFGNEVVIGDITKVGESLVPKHDLLLAGFPCQAFSLAGARRGFEDIRGTLFFDVVRIVKAHKPRVVFCENVKGLTIHDKGRTFSIIVDTLSSLGYSVYHRVLNSKDFGVPQNRERIYIVAFRNDTVSSDSSFPEPLGVDIRIKDILEDHPVSVKYYLSTQYLKTLREHKERHQEKGHGFGYEIRDTEGIAGAIVVGGMGRERNLIIDERISDYTPITKIKGEVNRENIRRMTPREWARLQGFPDSFILPLADVRMYKQLGNSVSVPVIKAIAGQIRKVLCNADGK